MPAMISLPSGDARISMRACLMSSRFMQIICKYFELFRTIWHHVKVILLSRKNEVFKLSLFCQSGLILHNCAEYLFYAKSSLRSTVEGAKIELW